MPTTTTTTTSRTLLLHTGLVFVGGTAGTSLRYAASLAVPTVGGWPLATLLVNVTGAFVLALLLEWLTARGPETTGRRRARLLLGTGVISGYTTYSTLAVETDHLLATGRPGTAAGYVAVTLVGGLLAVGAGHVLGTRPGSSR